MYILRSIWHILKSQSLRKISDDPYSTHIPILIGISAAYPIKSVLEYGSGFNSTLLFLNRVAFPFVEQVCSYENYLEWYENVGNNLFNEDRIDYRYVEGDMCANVIQGDIAQADLVFIDDSYSSKKRALTIECVLRESPSICLIHDFENIPYRLASSRFYKYYRFKSLLPNTGVCGYAVDHSVMKKIDNIIEVHSRSISNTDIKGWADIFSKHFPLRT